jgi:hypothetical protein
MPIKSVSLPEPLLAKLRSDRSIASETDRFLDIFALWLEDAQRPFFPQYTDHGIYHIESVISTSCGLVSEAAWIKLTPADCHALVVVACMHDCAMFLNERGFAQLISGSSEERFRSRFFDDPLWPDAWSSYVREARHFDDTQLTKIAGPGAAVRIPPTDISLWNETDKLLIGEFIRRYHHRMAEEFLMYGIPDAKTGRLHLWQGKNDTIMTRYELFSVIARSHGHHFREVVDVFRTNRVDVRERANIHSGFLMGLLRLADYFHISSERARAEWEAFRAVTSPFSKVEWELNRCIESLGISRDDPEALEITARPRKPEVFVRLRNLLNDLQAELDQTWAVLGEIYGTQAHTGLDVLGLTGFKVRRIRSNVQDKLAFITSEKPDFVPDDFAFTIDDMRLMQLLTGPLYAYDPSIGVRELIQNAVDAVRERIAVDPSFGTAELKGSSEPVRMRLRTDYNGNAMYLEISDDGIGMTEDTIRNYFLKIGASFRDSERWARLFTSDEGAAIVTRTGQFGIGVLSAFLLGDRIGVATRHYQDARGLRFSASPRNSAIDLFYTEGAPVGTTVRVEFSDSVKAKLGRVKGRALPFEAHYYGSSPALRCEIVSGHRLIGKSADADLPALIVNPGFLLPKPEEPVCSSWWHGIHPKYGLFHVSSTAQAVTKFNMFVNGLGVQESNVGWELKIPWTVAPRPFICSVHDRDRRIRFSLDRSKVLVPDELQNAILETMCEDLLTELLVLPEVELERPVTERNWQTVQGADGPPFARTLSGAVPVSLVHELGGTVLEVVLQAQSAQKLEEGFGIPLWHPARTDQIEPLQGEIRSRLASCIDAFDFVLVNTSGRFFANLDLTGPTFGSRLISELFGVMRDAKPRQISGRFISRSSDRDAMRAVLFADTVRTKKKRDVTFLRFHDFALTAAQEQAMKAILESEVVVALVAYKPMVAAESEVSLLGTAWKKVIGRGLPYVQSARDKMLGNMSKRLIARANFHRSRRASLRADDESV